MQTKNIILIGFMASGKTFTSREIAKKLRRRIVSTDALIEQSEKAKIKDIFEKKGETYFRRLESQVVKSVAKKKNVIIDCGGGVVLNPDNIKCLKKSGILVYLKTSPAWVLKRIKLGGKKRPLLNVKNPLARIKALLRQRKKMYEQADIRVNTDAKTPRQVAAEILKSISI